MHIDLVMPCIIRIHALDTRFLRNTFCLDMTCKLTRAITLIRNVHEKAIVDTLISLIDVRPGHLVTDHFNNDDIVNIINELSIV